MSRRRWFGIPTATPTFPARRRSDGKSAGRSIFSVAPDASRSFLPAARDPVSGAWPLWGRQRKHATRHGSPLTRRDGCSAPFNARAEVAISDQALPALDIMSHHPDLIHASMRPFGRHGPGADWPSTAPTLEALGGMTAIVGAPHRPPVKLGGEQAHYLAALNAAVATLLALAARDCTGVGQVIDTSVQESLLTILGHAPIMHAQLGSGGAASRQPSSGLARSPRRCWRITALRSSRSNRASGSLCCDFPLGRRTRPGPTSTTAAGIGDLEAKGAVGATAR
jgi:CoA-transferase family III